MSQAPTSADPPARLSAGIATARFIATCGGAGRLPISGTTVSLPVALLVWALAPGDAWLVVIALGVAAVGTWAADREEARLGVTDPSSIVVDEVAGMLVSLLGSPRSLGWVLLLFFLFRVMDVWKPFPIRQLQDLPGGFGIVLDDLLAGVYAAGVGALFGFLWRQL